MDKLQIAEELLKNSTDNSLSKYIREYIECLKNNRLHNEEMILLDNGITYIRDVNFDFTGWMLQESPIGYSYIFYNEANNQRFDLAIFNTGEVVPRYIKESNERDADTIQEAISEYDSGVGME